MSQKTQSRGARGCGEKVSSLWACLVQGGIRVGKAFPEAEVRGPSVRRLPAQGVGEGGRAGVQVVDTWRAPWGHPQLLNRF